MHGKEIWDSKHFSSFCFFSLLMYNMSSCCSMVIQTVKQQPKQCWINTLQSIIPVHVYHKKDKIYRDQLLTTYSRSGDKGRLYHDRKLINAKIICR